MKTALRMFKILSLSTFIMLLFTFSFNGVTLFADTNTGIETGQKAPAFTLSTVDGKELDLESFGRDKSLLLVFGATWCPHCRHEVPLLKEYYNEFKDKGLEVLGIDIQESKKKVGSFVK